jgi:hypothetical protein
MTEHIFLEDKDGTGAERFRVEERMVMCARCGIMCRESLCRECEAILRARPLEWPGSEGRGRRLEDREDSTGKG